MVALPAHLRNCELIAYRQGFSTEDYLISLALLLEASAEWNVPLWLGLVDFERAFDTVEHAPLWDALEELGVESGYVDLLKTLYRKQASTVLVGEEAGHLHWSVVSSKAIH